MARWGLPQRSQSCEWCGLEESVYIDAADPYKQRCWKCYDGAAEQYRGDRDHRLHLQKHKCDRANLAGVKDDAAELRKRVQLGRASQAASHSGGTDGSGTSERFKDALIVNARSVRQLRIPPDLVAAALIDVQKAARKAKQYADANWAKCRNKVFQEGGNSAHPEHDYGPATLEFIRQPDEVRELVPPGGGLIEGVTHPDNANNGVDRQSRYAARMADYPAIGEVRKFLWTQLRPGVDVELHPLHWAHATAFLPRSKKHQENFLDGGDAWKSDDQVFPKYRMHSDKALLWARMDRSCSVEHGIASVTLHGTANIFVGVEGCRSIRGERTDDCLVVTTVQENDAYAIHSKTEHAVDSSNNRVALVFRGLNYTERLILPVR